MNGAQYANEPFQPIYPGDIPLKLAAGAGPDDLVNLEPVKKEIQEGLKKMQEIQRDVHAKADEMHTEANEIRRLLAPTAGSQLEVLRSPRQVKMLKLQAQDEVLQNDNHTTDVILVALQQWAESHRAPDEPLLVVSRATFSPRQLVEEVRRGTRLGKELRSSIIEDAVLNICGGRKGND